MRSRIGCLDQAVTVHPNKIVEISSYVSTGLTYSGAILPKESKKYHNIFQHILPILVHHIFFATSEGVGCLQIVEKDRAIQSGPANLEGTAVYQALEFSGSTKFRGISRVVSHRITA